VLVIGCVVVVVLGVLPNIILSGVKVVKKCVREPLRFCVC
jgi:hypothetical protein